VECAVVATHPSVFVRQIKLVSKLDDFIFSQRSQLIAILVVRLGFW
jgi:hypothetical protein